MDVVTLLRAMAAGLAGTAVMTIIELAARSQWGLEGLLDWQINQATLGRIAGRPAEILVLPGIGFHFLHGLVAGLLFALALPLFPSAWPIVALGLGYGAVLFGITLLAYRPATRRSLRSAPHRSAAVGVGLLTHLVYGAVLALLLLWA